MKESIFSFIRGQACSGWDCVYSQDFLVSSFVQTWQSVSEKFIGIPLAINNSKVIWIFCLVLCWYPILASHYPLFSLRRLKFLWTASTKLNHSQQGAFKAVHNQNKLQKLLRLDKKKRSGELHMASECTHCQTSHFEDVSHESACHISEISLPFLNPCLNKKISHLTKPEEHLSKTAPV